MPVVVCPGCKKQYKISAAAAGQVAKCACGKRFWLGGSKSSSASVRQPQAAAAKASPTKAKAAPVVRSQPPGSQSRDTLWDEVLQEEQTAKATVPPAVSHSPPAPSSAAKPELGLSKHQPPALGEKKQKKKKKKIRWGFDWGKVVSGGAVFLIAGGFTLGILLTTGYLYFWPAGIAVVGFFTMLSGLMGEEGIW